MVYLGSDHGGFVLKDKLKLWLSEWGYPFEDMGALTLDPNDDYPDFAFAVARKVVQDLENRGILLCRSGAGMVIAANKVKGVRAVDALDERSAYHAREHNNANIIVIGADWVEEPITQKIIKTFLDTVFSNEARHVRRLQKIEQM